MSVSLYFIFGLLMWVLYLEDNLFDVDLVCCVLVWQVLEIVLDIVVMLVEVKQWMQLVMFDYDLIFLDLCLFDGSGIELLVYVWQWCLVVVVVIFIGLGDQVLVIVVLKVGVDDYVVKCVDYVQCLIYMFGVVFVCFCFEFSSKV